MRLALLRIVALCSVVSTVAAQLPAVVGNVSTVATATGTFGRFNWTINTNSPLTSADDTIDVTFGSVGTGAYLALGLSEDKMIGVALFAIEPAAALPGSACQMRATSNFGIASGLYSANVMVVSTTASTVTCRAFIAEWGIRRGENQRVIIAAGPASSGRLSRHCCGTDNRETGRIDFFGGTSLIGLQTGGRTVAGALLHVALLVWVCIGGVLHYRGSLIRHSTNRAFAISFQVMIVAIVWMYFAVALNDLRQSAVSAPVSRAFAHATSMSFMFMLYPVPKSFGFVSILGSSYDRMVSFHVVNAVLVWVMVTCHWGSMSVEVLDRTIDAVSTSDRYVFNPLVGFLCWLVFTFVLVVAFPLKAMSYAVFRSVHLLYVPIVLLCVIHYPSVLITIAIPLINFGADLVFRIVAYCRTGAIVSSAAIIPGTSVCEVTLTIAPGSTRPAPGDFALCTLGLGFYSHPYNVAWVDESDVNAGGDGTARVTLLVQPNGPTTQLLVDQPTAVVGRNAAVVGWFGSTEVPLKSDKIRTVFLVAGGIGITWVMRIAQCIATNPAVFAPAADSIVLYWCCGTASLYDGVRDKLQILLNLLHPRLQVRVFFTKNSCPTVQALVVMPVPQPNTMREALAVSVPTAPPAFEYQSGRPDIATEVKRIAAESSGDVAVFCSGPRTMRSDVESAVTATPGVYFTSQRFVLV